MAEKIYQNKIIVIFVKIAFQCSYLTRRARKHNCFPCIKKFFDFFIDALSTALHIF